MKYNNAVTGYNQTNIGLKLARKECDSARSEDVL